MRGLRLLGPGTVINSCCLSHIACDVRTARLDLSSQPGKGLLALSPTQCARSPTCKSLLCCMQEPPSSWPGSRTSVQLNCPHAGNIPLPPQGVDHPFSKPGECCFFTLRKILTPLQYRHLTIRLTSYYGLNSDSPNPSSLAEVVKNLPAMRETQV